MLLERIYCFKKPQTRLWKKTFDNESAAACVSIIYAKFEYFYYFDMFRIKKFLFSYMIYIT